jgi:carbamoyltransferase
MVILGICGGIRSGNHDPAAVLYRDGKLVAAAEEERFLRIKHSEGRLPENAVRFCLAQAGLSIRDVDCLAYGYATVPGMDKRLKDYFTLKFGYCPEVRLIRHFMAHAASAYRVSGFPDAMVLSADVSGDSVSTLLSFGKGSSQVVKSIPRPTCSASYSMSRRFSPLAGQ